MPNEQQSYSQSKKLFEQTYCKDETLTPINDLTNEENTNDSKYESSSYKFNSIQNTRSVGNYSNESSDRDSYNFEMNGEPIHEDSTSLQNSHKHMHNNMNTFDVNDENNVEVQRDKMETSFNNDIIPIDEPPKIDDHKSISNNYENNSNVDIQKMSKDIYNRDIRQSNNDHHEQKNEKFMENGKRNGSYYERNYETNSYFKGNEHNHRQYGDRERSNFKDTNMYGQTYNKINNRFVRRRFEDFRGRRRFNDRDMSSYNREGKFQDFRKYSYHSTTPRHQILSRRTNFNENKYNMPRGRHSNEVHDFKNSRKRYRFSQGIDFFRDEKPRENYKNVSQQSSPSAHREIPQIHHSQKRSKKSVSLESEEDDKTSHKDNLPSDGEKSPTAGFSDSRGRFRMGSSGLGGYSPRRRRSETAIKTPSPPPRSPDRRKTRAWDMVPLGIDNKVVAAIQAAHSVQQAVAKQVSTLSSISPLVSMNIANSTNNLYVASNPNLSSIIPSILHQVNPPLTTVTLTQATRSIRRLYVGNVPSTVSDGELMEFMNAAMLSANANYIPGTKPCINCIVSFLNST